MKKCRVILSNYKTNLYKACQFWLERVQSNAFLVFFSSCSLIFKLKEFKVTPFWTTPTHLQDSKFEKSGPKFSALGGIVCDTYG